MCSNWSIFVIVLTWSTKSFASRIHGITCVNFNHVFQFQYPFSGNYESPRHKKLIDLIDPNVYIPLTALRLSPEQELELRRRVAHDLRGFDLNKLKDIYLQLTAFDAQISGFIDFRHVEETFSKYKVPVQFFFDNSLTMLVKVVVEARNVCTGGEGVPGKYCSQCISLGLPL